MIISSKYITRTRRLGKKEKYQKSLAIGTSLMVQWLRLQAANAGGMGLIPGQGTKIPHAAPSKIKSKLTTKLIVLKTIVNCFL